VGEKSELSTTEWGSTPPHLSLRRRLPPRLLQLLRRRCPLHPQRERRYRPGQHLLLKRQRQQVAVKGEGLSQRCPQIAQQCNIDPACSRGRELFPRSCQASCAASPLLGCSWLLDAGCCGNGCCLWGRGSCLPVGLLLGSVCVPRANLAQNDSQYGPQQNILRKSRLDAFVLCALFAELAAGNW